MAEDNTKDGSLDYKNRPANSQRTGTWNACTFILGNACFERVAYYGMSSNLILYFTNQLNQHNAEASKNLSKWFGTCFVSPLLGAFLADSYLGRYWTIASFSIIYVVGMMLLTLSAWVPNLKPTCYEKDKCYATSSQRAFCFAALYLVALGFGGIRPCVSSYGADQFDDADEVEKARRSSFFSWFFFTMNAGMLIGCSFLVWFQVRFGWGWGFGVSAAALVVSVSFFFCGTRLYRYHKPGGSPLTRLCQVVVAAIRKYHVVVPDDKSLLYETPDAESAIVGCRKLEHTNELRFFDKAAVELESDHMNESISRWRLCTVTQVEELKGLLRLLPVWATGIILSAVYAQMGNLFLLQAEYMDAKLGSNFTIPEASLAVFNAIGVISCVPIHDHLVLPMMRKLMGHPNGLTQLQRIGVGLFVSIFAMISAAVVEMMRLQTVKRNGSYDVKETPISIFWQVPQYFIIGCSQVFTNIAQLEFFYEQAPDSLRSLCAALLLTTTALGGYLSSLLVGIVMEVSTKGGKPGWIPDNLNYGHMHYFFWLLAVLSLLNLGAFVVVAKMYTHKKPVGAMTN